MRDAHRWIKIGNAGVDFEYQIDYATSKRLDTKVMIGNQFMCTIAGKDQDAFADELNAVVRKYQL